MKQHYTLEELAMFDHLRNQGCAVCVFLPSELNGMDANDAETIMCANVNDSIPDITGEQS